jgi:hypothetical protein
MVRYFLMILIFSFAQDAFAENVPFVFNETGKFPSGKSYSLKIEEHPFSKSPNTKPDDGSTWGIDGGYPLNVVKKFFLRLNEVEISIPRKYYSDICDISKVSIEEKQELVILKVKGGDGAGSFNAEYVFKNNRLIERMVRMGEFPDEVWEKTILHNEMENN